MKYILPLLLSIFSFTYGDMIGSVTYELPDEAKEWQEATKMDGERFSLRLLVPKDVRPEESLESFGIVYDRQTTDIHDLDAIKSGLEANFPQGSVVLNVLDKDDDSTTIEWYAEVDGNMVHHAVSRIFASPDGTVTLIYMTQDPQKIDHATTIWLPALKKARKEQR